MNTKKKPADEKFSENIKMSLRPRERKLILRAVALKGRRGEIADWCRGELISAAMTAVEHEDPEALREYLR